MKRQSRRGYWAAVLKRFERQEGSVAAFCKAEGISVASFYQWRKKLGKPGFVEVKYHSESVSNEGVRIRLLQKGMELTLPCHWTGTEIASLIKALETC